MKLTACAYARYSSEKQQESSIVVQLAYIKKFCEDHNITLVREYIDEAQTGTVATRKAFQEMIADAPKGEFKLVLVHRMDRWARNVDDARHYKKQLGKYGVKIISVVEDFDETPEGEFFELLSMGMAELYSKKLSRESFAGRIANAKECKIHGGLPLLGYKKEGKHYVIEEKEVEAVRLIFKMVAEGYGYKYIANYLNSNGYRRANGKPYTWHLYEMLRNRKYIGEYVFNISASMNSERKYNRHKYKPESEVIRIPNGIPRIIDDETFFKVQTILDSRRSNMRPSKPKDIKHLLCGLIRCSTCERAICGFVKVAHNIQYGVYCCGGAKDGCSTKEIRTEYLDEYIIHLLQDCLLHKSNSTKLVALVKACYVAAHDRLNEEIAGLREQVRKIEQEVKSLFAEAANINDNTISRFMSKEIMEKQNEIARLNDLIFQTEYAGKNFAPFDPKLILKQAEAFATELQTKSLIKRNALLRKIIRVIYVDNEHIKVTFNFHEFLNSPNAIVGTVIESRDSVAIFEKHRERIFDFAKLTVAI